MGDEPGFQPIFDGKTLAGWEGNPTYWRVEDGALVGEITPATVIKSNTFIIWRGGTPKDFELKLDYRITPGGNSGINYRSAVVPDPVTPENKFAMRGYQCDIDGAKRYVGNNYEEKGTALPRRPRPAHPGRRRTAARARVDDRRSAGAGEPSSPTMERRSHRRARQHADAHRERPGHERCRRRRRANAAGGRAVRRAGARRARR